MAATEEYIFMAVPDESPTEDTLKYINEKTSTMSANCILPLPDLKVRSLQQKGKKRGARNDKRLE